MTDLNLPEPIAAYFRADRQNPDALARCFTPQATVKDEGRTHTGQDAIRAWKEAASARFDYTTEPFVLEQDSGHHTVRSRVTGNFPGSPVNLRYRFRLERGVIASLEITA